MESLRAGSLDVAPTPAFLGAPGTQLVEFFHFSVQRSGRLFLVVGDEAVRKCEELSGLAIHDAFHLFRPERGNGGSAFALAAVLPPSAECRESELDGFVVGVWSEPGTENGCESPERGRGS